MTVVLCLVAVIVRASANPVPLVITVVGTRSEVAREVGRQTADRIAARLGRSDIQQQILPFLNTSAGRIIFDELVNRTARDFPQYLEELHSLAKGSQHSFEHVFVLNALQELTSYPPTEGSSSPDRRRRERASVASNKRRATSSRCTDILTQPYEGELGGFWGHNEDGGVGDRELNYFVNATIFGDEGQSPPGRASRRVVVERFMAYSYVGTVAGLAYGWNGHGLVMSENAVFNKVSNYRNVPTSILGRAVMAMRSIDDAISLFRWHHGSEACNVNLGHYPSGRLVTMEVDPFNYTVSVKEVFHWAGQAALPGLRQSPYFFIHVNFFQVLQSPSYTDVSSLHRLATLAKYHAPNSTHDIRRMLGDTSDPQYPVYRNVTADDDCQTLTTAVWDLRIGTVDIYNDNPATSHAVFAWALRLD